MDAEAYDLWYDANTVGADHLVGTWISHGPRADDSAFDPKPGDWVRLGDDDELPRDARVIRRDGNPVWAQIEHTAAASASTAR